MNNTQLENLIRSSIPIVPAIECNSKKILQECKIQKIRHQKHSLKLVMYTFLCFVFSMILVLSLSSIIKVDSTKQNINVDKGKNPYYARVGYSDMLYSQMKEADPNWEPTFDRLIAWGPELASGTISLDVLINSNLINYTDKTLLQDYSLNVKKKDQNHDVCFQIAFGIKNNKDYIMLIDYLGYDKKEEKELINTFIFESNLTYSFDSVVAGFESMINTNISDEFLNDSFYDDQNLLSSGIIIGFVELDGFYYEYYALKLNGNIYTINNNN